MKIRTLRLFQTILVGSKVKDFFCHKRDGGAFDVSVDFDKQIIKIVHVETNDTEYTTFANCKSFKLMEQDEQANQATSKRSTARAVKAAA